VSSPKEILNNDLSPATSIFYAARKLLGPTFEAWEPESIWLELQDQSVDLSVVNRDKLLAAMTLLATGSFYWDAAVFENTAMAFSHEWSAPEIMQEASPGQLAWTVCEAEILRHKEGKEEGMFDHEPAHYAAICLHRDGFIVAPESLEFAQDELDKFNRGHHDLKSEVLSKWKALDKTSLDHLTLEETPVDVQLGKLVAVFIHIAENAARLVAEL
jgi:hypothetical protein